MRGCEGKSRMSRDQTMGGGCFGNQRLGERAGCLVLDRSGSHNLLLDYDKTRVNERERERFLTCYLDCIGSVTLDLKLDCGTPI